MDNGRIADQGTHEQLKASQCLLPEHPLRSQQSESKFFGRPVMIQPHAFSNEEKKVSLADLALFKALIPLWFGPMPGCLL